jgi:nucleoside-diphosphate-sugar epimerase
MRDHRQRPPRGGGEGAHRPMLPMPSSSSSSSLWTPLTTAVSAAALTAHDDDVDDSNVVGNDHVAVANGHLDDSMRQDDENDDDDDDDEEYSPLPAAVLGGAKAKESPSPFPMVWNEYSDNGTGVAVVTTPGRVGGLSREGLHHRHVATALAPAGSSDVETTSTLAVAAGDIVGAGGETVQALHHAAVHSPSGTRGIVTIIAGAVGGTTSPLRQRRLLNATEASRVSPFRFPPNQYHHGGVMLSTSSSFYKQQQQQQQQASAGLWPWKQPAIVQFLFKTKARRNGIISLGLLLYFGGLWQMHQQASNSSSSVSYVEDASYLKKSQLLQQQQQSPANQYSSYYYSWRRGGEGEARENDNDDEPAHEEDDNFLLQPLRRKANDYQQERELQARFNAQERIQTRRLARQGRTRPTKSSTSSMPVLLHPPPRQRQQVQPPLPPKGNNNGNDVLASAQDLCGNHAKRAIGSSTPSAAGFYGLRDALSRNHSSTEIRVVLTGSALAHPLGWLLVLQLQQTCGVQVVAMVDPMQPATRLHRLQHYAQRLMLLQNRLPDFRVLESFVGWQGDLSILDKAAELWKRGNNDKRIPTWPRLMQTTGDVNLFALWKPTHVVHFAPPTSSSSSSADSRDENSELSNAFQIQSSLVSLEQVLASAATTPHTSRPHVVFATTTTSSSSTHGRSLTDHLADMQLILAMSYHDRYQVQSVHVQLPNAMLGPHSTLNHLFHHSTSTAEAATTQQLDVVYAADVAQAMIAAMQFRAAQPTTFALGSNARDSTAATTGDAPLVLLTTPQLKQLHESLLAGASNSTGHLTSRALAVPTTRRKNEESYTRASSFLGWSPQTSLEETLLRTHAWSLDYERQEEQNQWMIPPAVQPGNTNQTGDEFLTDHAIKACAADDWVCHASPQFMPCASECSYREQCTPSGLDGDLVSISKESSEGCDIVLYTQLWGSQVKDFDLKSEYMEDGNPLICNYAFVSRNSSLVKSVIDNVPDTQLLRFGVTMSVGQTITSLDEQKLEKLNGRLLYRGWVLLWSTSQRPVSDTDSALLKLSPGRFFAEQVKFALYVEPTLPVAPTINDICFLVKQMHRDPLPTRAEKTTKPQLKFKLPSEPERRAIILLPQLRMQDSKNKKGRDIPSELSRKLSIKMATKYMRYELSVRRESIGMKRQREFYEKLLQHINGATRNFLHPPDEPIYRISFTDYWVRTRWVLHDLKLPESRQLRCEWFHEHLQWSSAADSSSLDQLSFAAVMAKRELQRRTLLQEPDDVTLHKISSLIDTKKKLTDAFEWHPAYFPSTDKSRQDFDTTSLYKLNRLAYHSFDVLHPDKNRTAGGRRPALYVRIISDRLLSGARKTWNR